MQMGLYFDMKVNAWLDCVIVNTNLLESRSEVLIAIGQELIWTKASRVVFESYVIA